MKSLLLLTAFIVTVHSQNLSAQNAKDRLPGGFSEGSKTDETVLAAAKFAVNAHDPKLQFKSVDQVEAQVVAGTNYRITLTVLDKGMTRRADVVVWKKVDPTFALTSWQWSDRK